MDKVNQLYMAVKQAGLTGDITGKARKLLEEMRNKG